MLIEELKRAEDKMKCTDGNDNASDPFSMHTIFVGPNQLSNNIKVSTFLSKTEWVELSKSLFDPLSLTKQCTINDETIKRADSLYKSLSNQLTHHICR